MLSLKCNKIQWLWNYLVKYDMFYFMWQKKQWRSEPSAEILDTQIRRTW